MASAESYVQVPADSTGKKMRTVKETIGSDEVHNEGVVVCDAGTTTQTLAVDSNGKIGVSSLPSLATGSNEIGNVKISDGTEQVNVNASNQLEVSVENNPVLGAGSNAIGKLAANSGVDIGDVDVTSISAGTNTIGKTYLTDGTEDAAVNASNQLEVSVENTPTVNTQQSITYDHAVFDSSSSGNLVAAAGAGLVTKVHALTLQAQGTVVVNLTDGDGGSSLMEWSLQAREGAVLPLAAYPAHWLQTTANTALYVQLSASQTVTMNVIYSDEDAS